MRTPVTILTLSRVLFIALGLHVIEAQVIILVEGSLVVFNFKLRVIIRGVNILDIGVTRRVVKYQSPLLLDGNKVCKFF